MKEILGVGGRLDRQHEALGVAQERQGLEKIHDVYENVTSESTWTCSRDQNRNLGTTGNLRSSTTQDSSGFKEAARLSSDDKDRSVLTHPTGQMQAKIVMIVE